MHSLCRVIHTSDATLYHNSEGLRHLGSCRILSIHRSFRNSHFRTQEGLLLSWLCGAANCAAACVCCALAPQRPVALGLGFSFRWGPGLMLQGSREVLIFFVYEVGSYLRFRVWAWACLSMKTPFPTEGILACSACIGGNTPALRIGLTLRSRFREALASGKREPS